MTTRIGLAVIGCGWGACDLYAPAFRYLEQGELIGCFDLSRDNAEDFVRRARCGRVYDTMEEAVADPRVHGVMVVTPPHVHVEAVVAAAGAGKHVYCEKPMAKTVEQADEMIAACERAGVKLQIAFMKRFNPSFLRAKELIDEGRLGDVFECRAIWDNARCGSGDNYRHKAATGGGYLQEDGSHPLDVCRWLMGEVEEVSAHALCVATDRFENDDVAQVMMRHRGGGISSLHITMLTHRTGMESYEVFGTKATLLMRWFYHSTHSMEPAVLELYEGAARRTDLTLSTSWDPHGEYVDNWQYLNELRHFCDCIIHGRPPRVTGADGRAVVEVVNAAYVSQLEDRKVHLPLDRSPDFDALFAKLHACSPWEIGAEEGWWSRY